MREIRLSGSEGGGGGNNRLSLPLSTLGDRADNLAFLRGLPSTWRSVIRARKRIRLRRWLRRDESGRVSGSGARLSPAGATIHPVYAPPSMEWAPQQ